MIFCANFCGMIQDGDLFTVSDLKDSVQQVTDAENPYPKLLYTTPQEYAEKNIALYQDVKSSAVSLDNSLKKAGFKTTYRFAYNYNIPGLTPDKIISDAYKLEFFYELASMYMRKTLQFPKQKIFDDAMRVSYYYAQYIWAANPGVCFDLSQKLDMRQDWGRVLKFLQGVGFKFHPLDVYEFTINFNNPKLSDEEMRAERRKQQVFKDWCARRGVDTGCLVLSDAHRDKLRKIINKTDVPYFLQLLSVPFKKR